MHCDWGIKDPDTETPPKLISGVLFGAMIIRRLVPVQGCHVRLPVRHQRRQILPRRHHQSQALLDLFHLQDFLES